MYPFERFSEATKRVLTLAQEEAERAHHSYIGTEHILLGLLRERDTVASVVLDRINVDIDEVRRAIDTILGAHERIHIHQIIPTSRVKTLIEISFTEARRMGDSFVGTEHILLGLLIEGQGVGAHVLNDLGANLEKVKAEIDVVRKDRTIVEEPGSTEFTTARGVAQDYAASAPSGHRLVLFERAGEAADDSDPVYVNPMYVVRLDPAGADHTSITLRHDVSAPLVVRGAVHEVARAGCQKPSAGLGVIAVAVVMLGFAAALWTGRHWWWPPIRETDKWSYKGKDDPRACRSRSHLGRLRIAEPLRRRPSRRESRYLSARNCSWFWCESCTPW